MRLFLRILGFIAIAIAALAALAIAQLLALIVPIDEGQELSRLVVAGILRGAV
jgi:hypothetical protein